MISLILIQFDIITYLFVWISKILQEYPKNIGFQDVANDFRLILTMNVLVNFVHKLTRNIRG